MKVYIAGPYTKGGEIRNVRIALQAANHVIEAGHIPFVPHLYHFWELFTPKDHATWMILCKAWVASCKAVIRLPGESSGSDQETEVARSLVLPVFKTVDDFILWAQHAA